MKTQVKVATAAIVVMAATTVALADAAVMAPVTSESLKPWVEFFQPYVAVVAMAVATTLAGIVTNKLNQWFNVKINQAQIEKLKSAAATEAGALVAKEADNLAGQSINISDPRIRAAADAIIAKLPDTAAALHATPEGLRTIVMGEIGKLQATQSSAAVVAVPVESAKNQPIFGKGSS